MNWVDPYPNEAGCAWAKQRRYEMEQQKKMEAQILLSQQKIMLDKPYQKE